MTPHQLINQDSGKVEYYTPLRIVEAARRVMGGIDLDPASSDVANSRIMAKRFFTSSDDGLSNDWNGRVWLNHPFGRLSNPKWISKLEHEYALKKVTSACCITFASTSEKWFQPLLKRPQCYLSPRVDYELPDGGILPGCTKGSVVTYFGSDLQRFADEFSIFGIVKVAI